MRHSDSAIIIIGAGGIVQHAHLPAYKKAGYPIKGIFDTDTKKAEKAAADFGIPRVYRTMEEAVAAADGSSIFDIAIPASGILTALKQLPEGSTLLLQKPMGENLEQANKIMALCREKNFKAGINFQLRYAPYILKARELISQGLIGEVCDIEININVMTPWQIWEFLFDLPRMEIVYHSIHYIDLVRKLAGEPLSVFASTIKHPEMPQLASVKSVIHMNYGDFMRASILTNHCHKFGPRHQQSYIKIEGTNGAIYIQMGLLMDYPQGAPDLFEYVSLKDSGKNKWETVDIKGSWFPDAFAGSMGEMIKAVADDHYIPDNNLEDGLKTMEWVEKAYESNEKYNP
jgi:predicted dehydrogenase